MKTGDRFRPKSQFNIEGLFDASKIELKLVKDLGAGLWRAKSFYNGEFAKDMELTEKQLEENFDKIEEA